MARILVFTATGKVGAALCKILSAEGHETHGLTRGGAGPAALTAAGITPLIGDIRDLATIADKVAGFDAVFLASADAPDQDQLEKGAVDLLSSKGAPHVVKLSAQSAGLTPPVSFGVQHRACEEHLKASGLSYTILRPTFFQHSLLMMKDDIAKKASITAPMGEGRSAMVSIHDIAEVAARCLTDQTCAGKTYTLTGPTPVGFAEVTSALSSLLGKNIKYTSPPAPIARLVMPFLTGMPRWQTNQIVDLMVAIRKGAQEAVSADVETVIGRPPRGLETFLKDHKADFMA